MTEDEPDADPTDESTEDEVEELNDDFDDEGDEELNDDFDDEGDDDGDDIDDESVDQSDIEDGIVVDGLGDEKPVGELVDGRLLYDCTAWSGASRSLLDSMLGSSGVQHSWQGTVLGVPPSSGGTVDDVIDEVLAAATPSLEAGRDKVDYEVGTWSAALQSSLAESLVVAEIPYEWDEQGDLVVYAEDEDRVEEIFDALPDPDDPESADNDEGVVVQDLLSTLFVATGHLAKKPNDAESVLQAADTTEQMSRLSLPFGFEPAVWKRLIDQATALNHALVEEDPEEQLSDDELKEQAAALRTMLRQFV